MTGISSKSYWHLSRTLATQVGMSNDWLKAQGLVSIRALWMKGAGVRLRINVCFALVNRLVRTRMPGGVGRAG